MTEKGISMQAIKVAPNRPVHFTGFFIIPFNRMISRKHCRITNQTGIYYINDEGSANGTFVNGVRLNPGQKVQINRGDIIRMADSDFQII